MSEPNDATGTLDSIDDIVNEMDVPSEETTTIPPVEDETEDEPEPESETEEEEESEETEETEEEEDETLVNAKDDTEYLSPVRRAEILKAYPDLFKKFPYLERAYYGNQQFREIYPTIADAKEAKQAAETLRNFESDIMTGSTKNLLKSIKDNAPDTFNRIADNYLKDLFETDSASYHAIVGNLFSTLERQMIAEADSSGNDSLKSAAVILNQFIFGDSKLRPLAKLGKDEPKDDNLVKERQQFAQQKYESAYGEISTKINNRIRSQIDENIDKSGSMSDYVKKKVSQECLDSVHDMIGQDKLFQAHYQKIWENVFRSNYSPESLLALRKAYISKAQGLLPSAIKKARQEALGSKVSRSKEGEGGKTNRTPIKPGRTATSRNSGKKEIPKGMSDMDFLLSD